MIFIIAGLISDSFHMFFDCTGLLAGLAASVLTKWKANDKYSYGYVRAEVLAGFVNSLFLLFIAFFIMSESVERLIEPPEVNPWFFCNAYSIYIINILLSILGQAWKTVCCISTGFFSKFSWYLCIPAWTFSWFAWAFSWRIIKSW